MSAQILSQPIAKGLMVVSTDGLYDEKRPQTVDGGHAAEHHHKCARRKFRMAAIISLGLSLLGIIALCALAALDPTGDDPGISFWRRAVGDSTSDQGPFVKNKLYIIVLVVGLIVALCFPPGAAEELLKTRSVVRVICALVVVDSLASSVSVVVSVQNLRTRPSGSLSVATIPYTMDLFSTRFMSHLIRMDNIFPVPTSLRYITKSARILDPAVTSREDHVESRKPALGLSLPGALPYAYQLTPSFVFQI
ncbi:hypothetical protein FRC19_008203 [Serendipita sp. 401]|nr:hypothetical protein FRC19_008203 [Serendipita sp. 401]